jgi:hypothetical protein
MRYLAIALLAAVALMDGCAGLNKCAPPCFVASDR